MHMKFSCLTSLSQSSRNLIFCCFWHFSLFDLRNMSSVYIFMWENVVNAWYFKILREYICQLGLPWPNILRNMLFQMLSKLSGAGYVLPRNYSFMRLFLQNIWKFLLFLSSVLEDTVSWLVWCFQLVSNKLYIFWK